MKYVGIILILLAFSLGLNVYLYRKGIEYYLFLNETRLDPFGLNLKPNPKQSSSQSQLRKIAVFGDSRAGQWSKPTGLAQFSWFNLGMSGQTSTQVLGRFLPQVVPLQPDILLVQVCINDLKTIPLFPQSQAWIIANCKNNIQMIIQAARAKNMAVILTTIMPLGRIPWERQFIWSDDVSVAIAEVNDFIRQLHGNGVYIFDTVPILADETGLVKREFSRDFLHLNAVGYQALNESLKQTILTVGYSRL